MVAAVAITVTYSAPASAAAPLPGNGDKPSVAANGHDAARPWITKQIGDQMSKAAVGHVSPRTHIVPLRARRASTATGITSAAIANSAVSREIFGFATAGNLADPNVGYTTWNYQLLSTIAFFGLHVDPNTGNFQQDTGWNVWHSSTASGLINAAHANGVKVVLTVIYQDIGSGMCTALNNGATTISQTKLQLLGADGINIDYEGVNQTCPDGQSLRVKLLNFVTGMRQAGVGYLSIDTYASSAEDPAGFFDIANLSPAVDAFFVMDYGLETSNGPCSTCLGGTSPLGNDSANAYPWNVLRSARDYAPWGGQTILGFPYYGVKACVSGPNPPPNAPVLPHTYGADPYATIVSYPSDPNIQGWTVNRDGLDPAGQEPWASFHSNYANCWREEYWDDALSLGHKYDVVNQQGFRGTGIWTLDFGGRSPELWNALANHFACSNLAANSVAMSVAATQSSTEFSLFLSASQACPVTGFDVQQLDTTPSGLNQSWLYIAYNSPPSSVGGPTYSTSVIAEGYPGRSYVFRALTHQGGGQSLWSGNSSSVTVSSNANNPHPFTGIYTLDAYGEIHGDASPPLEPSTSWSWQIARSAKAQPGSGDQAGLVLDGYGGLHPYGLNGGTVTVQSTAYWQGWDIARDLDFMPGGGGGYVMDGYGGLHPFGVNGGAMPSAVLPVNYQTYWPGWDIAKKVVILPDGTGGYILDGYGGLHPFGINGNQAPPAIPQVDYQNYWPGWNIARSVVLLSDSTGTSVAGYVLDGYGGLHPFASNHVIPPAISPQQWVNYWQGWDIARGVILLSGASAGAVSGYLLDGYGGLHPIAGNQPLPPAIPQQNYLNYWPGLDVARAVFGS
jgi:hypothetical protein